MRRLLVAAAVLAVGLILIGSGTSAPRAAGDFWLGDWAITVAAGEQGTISLARMSESEAKAELTRRAHKIGPNVIPPNEALGGCLAYLHGSFTYRGGGTWVGCSRHYSGAAVITDDNYIVGFTEESTGIGLLGAGQNPADIGGISVTHSRSCKASPSGTGYMCSPMFSGYRATRVETGSTTTKTVAEPKPGETSLVVSPPLPDDNDACLQGQTGACTVDVTVSSPTGLDGTAAAPEPAIDHQTKLGLLVYYLTVCFIAGEDNTVFTPGQKLRICLEDARRRVADDLHESGRSAAHTVSQRETAAANGCATTRIPIQVKVRKKTKKILSARRVNGKPTAKSVRLTCTLVGGEMHLKLDGRRKGGLRKAFGKRLDITLVRSKKAPRRSAKLNVTFGWK